MLNVQLEVHVAYSSESLLKEPENDPFENVLNHQLKRLPPPTRDASISARLVIALYSLHIVSFV
jgi:hypothetical protein